MKKILQLVLLFTTLNSFAQVPQKKQAPLSPKEKKEKMESMKIAFISTKLELTPDEAQKFWPVYNEFTKKEEELRKKEMSERKVKRNIDSLSDKEASALVDQEILFREQHLALIKEYNPKFQTVLSAKKVAKLYEAEKEFRIQMKKRMMNHANGKGQQRKPQSPPPSGK